MGLLKGTADEVWLDGRVKIPQGKGQRNTLAIPIRIKIRTMPLTEWEALVAERKDPDADEAADRDLEGEIYDRIVDWEVRGDDDELVPFSQDALFEARNDPYYHDAISQLVLNHYTAGGARRARSKN